MPEPTKTRLTVANVAVMLPIEVLVHALVVQTHLPYLAKVLVLTLTATVLVIWVAEPSAARILRRWLHAPALRHRRRLGTAPALWRARTVLRDEPGSLKRVTRSLAQLDTNILGIHVHPVRGGVMDEFVLSAPGEVSERQLLEALTDGGGRSAQVWPTTALATADGQTRALSLAARIASTPEELPLAVAELLVRPDPRPRQRVSPPQPNERCRNERRRHPPGGSPPPGTDPSPSSVRASRLRRPNRPGPTGSRSSPKSWAHRHESGLTSAPCGSPAACSAPSR